MQWNAMQCKSMVVVPTQPDFQPWSYMIIGFKPPPKDTIGTVKQLPGNLEQCNLAYSPN